jgi:hypothetical protein
MIAGRSVRAVVLGGVFAAGCAPGLLVRGPRLAALTPDSVQLIRGNVTEVELTGSGFDTSRTAPANIVRIGPLVLNAVPSSAGGTAIRVALPDAVSGGGEAPPAPWMAGRYPVTVTTKAGTSNALTLAIATPGGRP